MTHGRCRQSVIVLVLKCIMWYRITCWWWNSNMWRRSDKCVTKWLLSQTHGSIMYQIYLDRTHCITFYHGSKNLVTWTLKSGVFHVSHTIPDVICGFPKMISPINMMQCARTGPVWASYQIRKVAGCACAGNAGNVFPATDFEGNR